MTEIVVREASQLSSELRELADDAKQFAAEARAENTRLAYGQSWKQFTAWCDKQRLTALPAEPGTVALYFSALHKRGLRMSSLRVHRAAIARRHRMAGIDPVPTDHGVVAEVWAGITRRTARLGPVPRPKQELPLPALRATLAAIRDGLPGARDRAMLSIGFFAALRPSELAALRGENVRERAEGLELFLPVSKGDQTGQGQLVGCARQDDPAICPVELLRAWRDASGIQNGPLFQGMDPAGKLSGEPLTRASITSAVKRRARKAGLDPTVFGGHSLRSGFATTAARAGKRLEAIQHQLRHKSLAVLHRYIRRESIWENNASQGLR